ncbi:repulsive guidance molecule B-like [Daktulosphaira vitifoliae]|uniref:repulsive guidance molecule B-like n=1 Tax=Daktulosphaira vitifoliae TaxID=58002 RepID=UPI0021AAE5A1|nr:repulsive guidance molecule B-like [Daktulosphaira vitifoliae]
MYIMFVNKKVHLVWITWLAVTVSYCLAGYCPQEECSGTEQSNVKAYNCKDIETYIKCMKSLSKKCRGDISYHSAVTVLNAEFKKKCSGTDDGTKNNGTNDNTQSIIPGIYNRPVCPVLFDDHHEHKFCGLFGDPHLRTFDGRSQTCRIHGAWQVIDNPFISIMVTNDGILNSTSATATTKLTILLKSHISDCTTQKIYEAQGDFQLPESFGDGSTKSVSAFSTTVSLSWRSNDPNSETVIIRLSYISTIITITRVGKYLSVSAKLPNELAQTFNQEKNELCSSGCPTSEQFDIEKSVINDLEHSLNLCRDSIGPTGHQLTDQYLDWCVFDLMTSHDEQFVNASHAAYSDVLFFEPQSLLNRTISVFESGHKSTANITQCGCLKIFFIIFITIYKFML